MAETEGRPEVRGGLGWVRGCILTVFALIVAFLFAELLTRWVYPVPLHATDTFLAIGPADMREGRARPRWLRPNTVARHVEEDFDVEVRINSHGLRDRDIPYERPAGQKRVLAVGDSFTFGYGVELEDAFCKVAERLLSPQGDVAVLNCGAPSWGTADELDFLVAEGFRYGPDAVVLTFYENDIKDNLDRGTYRPTEEGADRLSPLENWRGGEPANGDLHTLDPFTEEIMSGGEANWQDPHKTDPPWLVKHSNLWRLGRRALSRTVQRARAEEMDASISQRHEFARRLTEGLLAETACECSERDIPLLIMMLPSREFVTGGLTREFERQFVTLAGDAQDNGAQVINLMPPLLEHGSRELYFPNNRHINEAGHRVVGEQMARWLRDALNLEAKQ